MSTATLEKPAATKATSTRRLAIGADHGGVDLKDALVKHLKAAGQSILFTNPMTRRKSTSFWN